MMPTLSKSKFISGVQCEKKLWFDFHRKDLQVPIDAKTQAVFDAGHLIGAMAQKVFPNGKDATPENYSNLAPSIENTKQWLSEGVETIYEATFSAQNAFCMLDILHRKDGELWAVEVKNATSVKEYHLRDASLQYFVMKHAGYRPERFFLMYINNEYVKNGKITDELFKVEDITERVVNNEPWVESNLQALLQIVENDRLEPQKTIGSHCSEPFACQYQHYCWSHVPENSVFELYRIGKKGWDLYEQGTLKIADIADDFPLTRFQNLQRKGLIYKEKNIETEEIKRIISKWQFPLYFFDFETIFPAIPVLDGTRPYQQIPFQYSLYILEADGTLSHKEFLASPEDFSNGDDPLKKMVLQLKEDFGMSGSIVTYNQAFEVSRLKQLAAKFPDDAVFLNNLIARIVDLLPVFQKGYCYFPEMRNSVSIKSVLPAVVPELTYKNLEIQEGGTASAVYLESIMRGKPLDEKTRNGLLKYCEMDTFAMMEIYKFLNNIILV